MSIIQVCYLNEDTNSKGDKVRARLGDKFFPAEIIELQRHPTDPLSNKYYIHFGHVYILELFPSYQVNRRMDTWMTTEDSPSYPIDGKEVCFNSAVICLGQERQDC